MSDTKLEEAITRLKSSVSEQALSNGSVAELFTDIQTFLTHFDNFSTQIAAAKEEQREKCAQEVWAKVRILCAEDLMTVVGFIRRTPLDSEPLQAQIKDGVKILDRLMTERDEARTDIIKLQTRLSQLETFIVDMCREKTTHGSTPSLITQASKLDLKEFQTWWIEQQNNVPTKLQQAEARIKELEAQVRSKRNTRK